MHSPVWVNYEPALDLEEYWSDGELSDDYFDSDFSRRKRWKVPGFENTEQLGPVAKKRKRAPARLRELSLGEPMVTGNPEDPFLQPTVLWKVRGQSPTLPVVRDGQGEKVAILKDWRNIPKVVKESIESVSQAKKREPSGIAVVIEQKPAHHSTRREASKTSVISRQVPSRSKPTFNKPSIAASTSLKQRGNDTVARKSKGAQKSDRSATETARKRKAPSATETAPESLNGKLPKKAKGPPESEASATKPSSIDKKLPTSSNGVKGTKRTLEPLASVTMNKNEQKSTRKRKVEDREDKLESEPEPKRTKSRLLGNSATLVENVPPRRKAATITRRSARQ